MQVLLDAEVGAAACKASYHMGAVLDVSEKACEAIKEVSQCAHHGKCSAWGELSSFQAAFDHANPESAWKVCCFRAYKIGGYQSCSQPDAQCKAAMDSHVLGYASSTQFTAMLGSIAGSQAKAKAALPKMHNMLNRLQDARGAMWQANPACQAAFANPQPNSACGWHSHPDSNGQKHSLARNDLYCETIEWQYKEMGAGDAFMKQCKGANAKLRTPAQQTAWNTNQDKEIKQDGIVPPHAYVAEDKVVAV